jgi:RND family efflux transporter MFP subunit
MRRYRDIKLGNILLKKKIITREQLEKALELQKTYGGFLGQKLLDLGYISEKDLIDCLTLQYSFPYKSILMGAAVLLILAYFLGGKLISLCFPNKAIRSIQVKPMELVANFSTHGIIQADREQIISSTILAKVRSIPVREGDYVAKDSTIVQLDDSQAKALLDQALAKAAAARTDLHSLKTAGIRQAEAMAISARARLKKLQVGSRKEEIDAAKADVSKAEVRLREARSALKRAREIQKIKGISLREFETYEIQYQICEEDLKKAKYQLSLMISGPREEEIQCAEGQLTEAEARLEKARSDLQVKEETIREAEAQVQVYGDKLAKTVIRSPISGLVIRRYVESDEVVAPGQPILRIVDPGSLYAEVKVEERYIEALRRGQKAIISIAGYPGTQFEGHIYHIASATAESLKMSLLKEEDEVKNFLVKVRLRVSPPSLKLGMSITARFRCKRKNALCLPNEAVMLKEGERYVWIVHNGVLQRRKVKIGLSTVDQVEILQGILPDDIVIARASAGLVEGSRIDPVQ